MTYKKCLTCYGYCCLIPRLWVTKKEIEKIAEYIDEPFERIKAAFINNDVEGLGQYEVTRPCYFWQYGKCSIYPVRPKPCVEYGPDVKDCKRHNKKSFKIFGVINLR